MLDAKLLQVDMRRFMHLVPYLQFKKRKKKKLMEEHCFSSIFLLSVLLPQLFQTPSLHVFVSQGHLLYIIYKILYNATIFQTLLKKNQLHDLEYHQPVTWSFWKKIQKLTHFKSMHLFNSINFILSARAHYISLIYFGIMAWNNISIT